MRPSLCILTIFVSASLVLAGVGDSGKTAKNSDPPRPRPQQILPELMPPTNREEDSRDEEPVRPLPTIRYLASKEISFEFEITKLGTSNIEELQVWVTADNTKSWQLYAVSQEVLPVGRHKRSMILQEEAVVYGFTLVAKSKAGLLSRPLPRAGDLPDMRVESDVTPPTFRFKLPERDARSPDTFILGWTVHEKNLVEESFRIGYSRKKDGPWQEILEFREGAKAYAEAIAKQRYAWRIPTEVKEPVYLRLRAIDKAGNEGIAITPDPIWFDVTPPGIRLIEVAPTKSDRVKEKRFPEVRPASN